MTKGLLQFVLLAICFVVVQSSLSTRQTDFTFGSYFAKVRRGGTIQLDGSRDKTQPRRLSHAACQGKYFVAWTARTGEKQMPTGSDGKTFWEEQTVGHITQFSISAAGVPSLVKDVVLSGCVEMGNMFCSEDGQIVSALCRSSADSLYNSIDFVAKYRGNTWAGGGFGFEQFSQTNPALPNYRIIHKMYLLEWSNGGISATPSVAVKVNAAIGGWEYGHFEVLLNAAKTVYFISLKTTIFGGGIWHEGAVSFRMTRGSWVLDGPSQWACGAGHVEQNRAVYHPRYDRFALFCKTDLDANRVNPTAAYYQTYITSASNPARQVQSYPARTNPPFWKYGNGGPMNLVPHDTGFLGVGLGPGGEGKPITIGVINLPEDHAKFSTATSAFKWINIPGTNVDNLALPATGYPNIGFPNLAKIGKSGRFLTGWAIVDSSEKVSNPNWANPDSRKHFVAEIDKNGCMYSGAVPIVGGWGQDNVWVQSPISGCVLIPFVWRDNQNPGSKYGACDQCAPTESTMFSKKLRITTVCNTGLAGGVCSYIPSARNAAVADTSSSSESENSQTAMSPVLLVAIGVICGMAFLILVVLIVRAVSHRNKQTETV